MPVSTIASALGRTGGINEESNKIIGFMSWQRTAEQMIWEYFGLRKEVIYADNGEDVIDMINEFRDPAMLKFKKVCYKPYFASKWLTEDMFYKIVPRDYVYTEPKEQVEPPIVTLVKDDENTASTWDTQDEPVVPRTRGRAKKATK
jgi:hypothetical protein